MTRLLRCKGKVESLTFVELDEPALQYEAVLGGGDQSVHQVGPGVVQAGPLGQDRAQLLQPAPLHLKGVKLVVQGGPDFVLPGENEDGEGLGANQVSSRDAVGDWFSKNWI